MTADDRLVARATVNPAQARAILGAMRDVAGNGGAISSAAQRGLTGAAIHVLHVDASAVDESQLMTPAALAGVLGSIVLHRFAAQLIAIMALVDGHVDPAKLERAVTYAQALGVHDDYVRDLAETAQNHIEWIIADMSRHNAESIRGIDVRAGFAAQFFPYNTHPDPELTARFRALGALPYATFGRAFHDHYAQNGYPFPGETNGLTVLFGVPHDSTHILSGYGTSAQGELLVSTFTAAVHRIEGMAGHILPVIYSWHLGIQFNPLAGSTTGAFDGEKFWRAWERGAATPMDTFGADFDFWSLVNETTDDLRIRFAVPPLAPEDAGDGEPRPVRPYP